MLKSAEELAEEQYTRQAAQSRISEVEEDLKSVVTEHDALKTSKEKDAAELKKLSLERQEAASRANVAKEEFRQATDIAAGKPCLLQCIFGSQAFPRADAKLAYIRRLLGPSAECGGCVPALRRAR